ncbi:MAG: ATP-dependent DNA helicase RecG [Clostridia bacterium]|nr:ATP-dependent DNA helicase RecG [Clostridia bacterium]
MELKDSVQFIKGVGGKRAELFKKLGIVTVRDLLFFFPRTYEDWSKICTIADAAIGDFCCIRAIADRKPIEQRIRKGLTIYKTNATDGTGILKITIFNSKFTAQKIEEGKEYLFFGRISGSLWQKEMNTPSVEKSERNDRIRPIYRQTESLSSKIIEKAVANAIDSCIDIIPESLPQYIMDKYYLCSIRDAIKNIHFPIDSDYASLARRRLIFEELLTLSLGLRLMGSVKRKKASLSVVNDCSDSFVKSLPFTLTASQSDAIKTISEDMSESIPMNRLLQGDVGSGKTVVAAAAVYNAVKNGFQAVFMAPTEILATQHYNTLCKMFENHGITPELLTGSTKLSDKRRIISQLANGETGVVVGTHAVLSDNVTFNNLGLVITDEQHRFGVEQRAVLGKKGNNPHVLVMSATPIPRTLALMIYGDLDISVLKELPKGRKPVQTFFVTSNKRERALNFVKQHLDKGLQGYVVCPLVEDGELDLISAESYAETLKSGVFKDYSVGLLHGKMNSRDKDRVMQDFYSGKLQLLVSTTVIEVGVDVPNAVIMVIENAERFGLSQLHQLRGRIGRGTEESTCILISDASNPEARQRLNTMVKTTDGFKIADEDLRMRGPGDFFGTKQHGLPDLQIANMLTDSHLLSEAASAAQEILSNDPSLSDDIHKGLRRNVIRLFSGITGGTMN